MLAFASGIFVSAFLLFQVQPILARYILPWFGGSPSVWTICILFFQLGLLAGYGYAHLLATRLSPRHQPLVHGALVLLSVLALPITPSADWIPVGDADPIPRIMLLLIVAAGAPFAILSASAPLLQRWFAETCPQHSPFRLYALSNLGSLLALLSYPLVVEPRLAIDAQTRIWSYGYGVFVCLIIVCGLLQLRAVGKTAAQREPARPVTATDRLLWIGLSACGSIVLLATTNQICQDVAVIPLLWVLPLSLYLISFIVCFSNDRWYHRGIWFPVLMTSVAAVVWLLNQAYAETEIPLAWQIGIYASAMFACCMVCHGELARRRSSVDALTGFYLDVALGGALGGVFVNLLAPLLFDGFWELHASLLATVVLAGCCAWSDRAAIGRESAQPWFAFAWTAGGLLITVFLAAHIRSERAGSVFNARSFYGAHHVYNEVLRPGTLRRSYYNGRIHHGSQLFTQASRWIATSYYGIDSGVAAAILQHPVRRRGAAPGAGLNIGVIGLGVGSVAVHVRPHDALTFYELDPGVEDIARKYFTYLGEQPGELDIVIGDARISLQRALRDTGPAGFDVLVLDAFSGDAVPVHLLTAEAFELYWRHLRPDGVLVVNITNFHVDLSDLVRQMAIRLDKQAILIHDPAARYHEFTNDWILVTNNRELIEAPRVRELESPFLRPVPRAIVWTDSFSNLLEVLY